MIPPHLFYQIYLSFLEQNDCTPPKCGELSEYTDSAHTEVEDPSLRQLHPSCTTCRRTAKGLFRQKERKPATISWAILPQQGVFHMHHPKDRIVHATAFATPVVEWWLELSTVQWVPMTDHTMSGCSTTELYLIL